MRKKLYAIIDLEDTSAEKESWLADTIALGHTIQDRLDEVENVTVHDIAVVAEDEFGHKETLNAALRQSIIDWLDQHGKRWTEPMLNHMLKGVHYWFTSTVDDSISTAWDVGYQESYVKENEGEQQLS